MYKWTIIVLAHLTEEWRLIIKFVLIGHSNDDYVI